jgi:hypothetical protein
MRNLPQQAHNLLRSILFPSYRSRLFSYQFLALLPVQRSRGTPSPHSVYNLFQLERAPLAEALVRPARSVCPFS